MSTFTPVYLPSARHLDFLPTNLPSTHDIRQSTAIIKQHTGETIAAVTPEVFVKYGRATRPREGQTLLYLEQFVPGFPAPQLYAMYYDGDDFFLVMQRIPGRSLETLWDQLSETDKDDLTARFRAAFDCLRSVPCLQPSYFGAVDGGAVPYHLFYSDPPDPLISGPFQSEQAFNAGLIRKWQTIYRIQPASSCKVRILRSVPWACLHNHKSVLTHSDVQRKNILIVDRGDPGSCLKYPYDICIVDWEDAGRYPEYWEYAVSFAWSFWNDDWPTRYAEFLPAWPAESAMLKMIGNDIWL